MAVASFDIGIELDIAELSKPSELDFLQVRNSNNTKAISKAISNRFFLMLVFHTHQHETLTDGVRSGKGLLRWLYDQ